MATNHVEVPAAGSLLRVLVVDDSTDTADSLGEVIRHWGHDARVAYDASTTLEKAERFAPEIILVDLGMPQMDGLALARAIRRHPHLKDVLIFAITGYADQIHRELAREAGINHYLVKPTDPEVLEILLQNVFSVIRIARLAGKETMGCTKTDTVIIHPKDLPNAKKNDAAHVGR